MVDNPDKHEEQKLVPCDLVMEARKTWWEIVESDGGECRLMGIVRELADEVERFRRSPQDGRGRMLEEVIARIERRHNHYDRLSKQHADDLELDKALRYRAMADEAALCSLSIRSLQSPAPAKGNGSGSLAPLTPPADPGTQGTSMWRVIAPAPSTDWSRELVKEIAMDIGKDVCAYIEVMYPQAVQATSSTFLLSVRNSIHNEIMAALKTIDETGIRERLAERKKFRRDWRAQWKRIRSMPDLGTQTAAGEASPPDREAIHLKEKK